MNGNQKLAALLLVPWLTLSACARFLGEDFDKARLIGEVEFGASQRYTATLTPPVGAAKLVVAVPNYRCATSPEAVVTFVVRSKDRDLWTARRRLSDMTWSYGRDSCDAYGYIYGSEGSFNIHDTAPTTIEVVIGESASRATARGSVWLVYGDRVPVPRIFGTKQ